MPDLGIKNQRDRILNNPAGIGGNSISLSVFPVNSKPVQISVMKNVLRNIK